MKREKTKLGPLEMQLLAYAQFRNKDTLRTGDLPPVLSISAKQERELLSRMARTGLIARLKRGVYLVPPRMPMGGRWGVNEYFILNKLMAEVKGKYQISGPTAFNFYGFDDQVPNRVYVYNNRLSGERTIARLEFVFIKTTDKRLGGNLTFTTPDGQRAVMVSKPRALLDAVNDWTRFNTLPRAYGWIASSLRDDPSLAKELTAITLRFGNQGTVRRIGYLLELLAVQQGALTKLKKSLRSQKSLTPWIAGQAPRGKTNRDWGLIVNGSFSL